VATQKRAIARRILDKQAENFFEMLQNGQSCVILNTTSNSGMIKEAFSTYLSVKPSCDSKLSDAFLSTLCFSELNFSYFPDTILIRETKFLYLTYFCLNFAILRLVR